MLISKIQTREDSDLDQSHNISSAEKLLDLGAATRFYGCGEIWLGDLNVFGTNRSKNGAAIKGGGGGYE